MPTSPTAYFAALMNFAQGIDIATADEHVIGAVFRLLEIVFPRWAQLLSASSARLHLQPTQPYVFPPRMCSVPTAVLRAKFTETTAVLEACLTARSDVQPAVRA